MKDPFAFLIFDRAQLDAANMRDLSLVLYAKQVALRDQWLHNLWGSLPRRLRATIHEYVHEAMQHNFIWAWGHFHNRNKPLISQGVKFFQGMSIDEAARFVMHPMHVHRVKEFRFLFWEAFSI